MSDYIWDWRPAAYAQLWRDYQDRVKDIKRASCNNYKYSGGT